METITIDGKTYKLVPIEEYVDSPELAARKKADLFISKYNDYKNIPRMELISRIKEIDAMTEWEYCKHIFETWVDWERLYNVVSVDKNCPYKSLGQFKETGMKLVEEVFVEKRSVETGFFKVSYLEGYTNDEGIWEPPEIHLNVIFYGAEHVIGGENRDYLLPEDD